MAPGPAKGLLGYVYPVDDMSSNKKRHAKITKYGEARHQLKLRDISIHKIKNVNYTGIRFENGQWKLHIGVTKKLPEHDKLLNPDINFSGLPLIFDEIGEIKALAADRKIKYRPAPPGVSVGHYAITAGTISVTCFKGGVKHFLSNNHVLANCNAAAIGDTILQQGAYDGGQNPADKIGTLAAFVPIVFNDQVHPNHVDCALCLPDDPNDLLDEILELGYPTGFKEAAVGTDVIKSGRTTGTNTGTITEFSGLITIGYGTPGTAYFDDQIITTPMLLGGDSGSCLLDASDHKAVGLCFAASDVISIACRMTEVMAALGITIFQSSYAVVTTQDATIDPDGGTITLNGDVVYAPGAGPHRYLEWGASSGNYTHTEDCGVGGVGVFSAIISVDFGSYYYRAKVIDGATTNYGREVGVDFHPFPPVVTTLAATTNAGDGTITLNGIINRIRNGTPHRYFQWGTVSGTYTHTEDCGFGGIGTFSKTISVDIDHYYYRTKVIDDSGTDYGAEMGVTLRLFNWGTEIVGSLCPLGTAVIVRAGGGIGLSYRRHGSLPLNRMMLMADGLLHVFDPGGNNSCFNPIIATLIDHSCKPDNAANPKAWATNESPQINAHNAFVISETIAMLDKKHPWIMMNDMFMGSDPWGSTNTKITVSMAGGDGVDITFGGSPGSFGDNTASGIPLVLNGQRYWLFTGGRYYYYGADWDYFGYFKLDNTGAFLAGNVQQTGITPITAWINGSAIEFAYWGPNAVMHICRISDPAGMGGWSEIAQIQVTPGASVDSTRMMSDGWLCMVLSIGEDKHILWYKNGVYHEDYLPLHTETDNIEWYYGAGGKVGTVFVYGGTHDKPKGVFGFKYGDPNHWGWLHLGVSTVELSGSCPTETLYHTILKPGDYSDSNGIGFAYPSVTEVNGKTFFLFGVSGYANVGLLNFEECLIIAGKTRSNAVWYGE